jgi:hypothetical protein
MTLNPELVIAAAGLVALLVVTYVRVYRPWQLRWGATAEEVARSLPGDELVLAPTFDATRAITIQAQPEAVWPWLVQVGVKRAGWYSYDLLDNFGRPSARRIIPELQEVAVGDVLPFSPDGKQGIPIYALDPPRSMIWGKPGENTWVWVLDPMADGRTRLIARVRSKYRWLSPSIAFSLLLEFTDIWMMRRMLLNLRERATATEASGADAGRASLEPTTAPPV